MRRYCHQLYGRKWYTTSNKLYLEYLFDVEDMKVNFLTLVSNFSQVAYFSQSFPWDLTRQKDVCCQDYLQVAQSWTVVTQIISKLFAIYNVRMKKFLNRFTVICIMETGKEISSVTTKMETKSCKNLFRNWCSADTR